MAKRGWRYWRNLGAFTLFALLGGALFLQYVGHPWFYSYGMSHPKRLPVCCGTPADHGLNYEDVSFTTADGLTLRGWYIPSRNGAAVMLLHPLAVNRIEMLKVAPALARHGYGVLMFDLRAHGESDGDVLPFGGPETEDVLGALAYLEARSDLGAVRIGVLGWSLGAQVGILGAARTDRIRAVVADAPGATTARDWPPPQGLGDWLYVPYDWVFYRMLRWRTGVSDPVPVNEAVARIAPRPILLIGGESDRRMLEHHYGAAREPKTLWVVPEGGHVGGRSAEPREYGERIARFFDAVLLESE